MMNKTIYIAPEAEQMEIRFEENILLSGGQATRALSNSSTEDAEYYGDGSTISW